MTDIEDTTRRDPALHLFGALVEGTSNYIENMEADGQRQLVNSAKLPTDFNFCTREEFEALGFTFGEVDPDGMFQEATLPEGWERKGSDHAMWSYIVDERGFERVAIFYKAAFYDRSAHMSLSNPGRSVASDFLYADTDDTTLDRYDLLTDEEKVDFAETLDSMAQQIERHPDIYGKYADRLATAYEVAKP
jgi:hypothetical protein